MSDLFISHVEEDAQIALALTAYLESAGFTTWHYERDTVPGVSYLLQTGRAIDNSQAVILIISTNSLGSNQVTKEVVRAHEGTKHFLPVLIDVSHVEFQKRQPEWREAIGAVASIALQGRGVEAVGYALVNGLNSLGIKPSREQRMQWAEYLAHVQRVIEKLRAPFLSGRYVPDALLGISSGGLIYADLLGRELLRTVPVLSLWADRSTANYFDNEFNSATVEGLKSLTPKDKDVLKVLLVDDISASGSTHRRAIQFLLGKMPSIQVHFLPLLGCGLEQMKEHLLWSSEVFGFPDEEIMKIHATDRKELPYGKELPTT